MNGYPELDFASDSLTCKLPSWEATHGVVRMKSTLLFLLPTALTMVLVGCGPEGKLPDTSAPPPISTSTLVQPTPTETAPTTAPVDLSATVASIPIELSALCSLNQEAARITCHANGLPENSESQLKWESNISAWKMGPFYEISIDEWVSEVVVKLESCEGSICERIETSIDTSWVNPREDNSESSTTTPRTTDEGTESVTTAPIPVAIESLTCDDNQITALYPTTCRAELS